MPGTDITRARAAILTLEHTRAEFRRLLMPLVLKGAGGRSSRFPRSKTIRWLLAHPVGRWLGSAVLTGVLARLRLVSLRS